MTLAAGVKLGPYEILSPLGAGGMGEVYKARDTRLDRVVAVKVLPTDRAESPEAKARFEREARAVSALSHPHICALYDVGSSGDVEYLVMEYLEGETLEERIDKGPLPIEQVLKFGVEIADALERAHRQGIIHRDLKPGNVMLTRSGVKLLDFGLAKTLAAAVEPEAVSSLPTQSRLTERGTIMGTFQYMSPEQLEGKDADARSDIFALGAVLYEMATGKKAFSGASRASLISSILRDDPVPISSIAAMTPPAFDRLVRTCLAKDREDRFQTAHDVKLQLEWIAEAGSRAGAPAVVASRRKSRERLAWIVAGVAAAFAVAVAAEFLRFRSSPVRVVRAEIALPPGLAVDGTNASLALSPDGRVLAIAAAGSDGKPSILLRPLDAADAAPLAGTAGATYPFWSPDAKSLGFFADEKLKRVDLATNVVQTICDAPQGRGATWGPDGTIVFAPDVYGAMQRVRATGGTPEPIEPAQSGEASHRNPHFLPGGTAVLYYSATGAAGGGGAIFVLDLATRKSTRILEVPSEAYFVSPGWLAWVRKKSVMVQPFDPKSFRLSGEPVPLAENVQYNPFRGTAEFAFGGPDLFVYQTESAVAQSQLTWFDADGNKLSTVGDPAAFVDMRISPDGTRAAATIDSPDNTQVWLVDLVRGVRTRFTFDVEEASGPVWSPDGRRLAFQANVGGNETVQVKDADGGSPAQTIYSGSRFLIPESWSSSHSVLSFTVQSPESRSFDVGILPMSGDHRPRMIVKSAANEADSRFSPDGEWLSYVSDEAGKNELYVVPYPGPGGKWQISSGGVVRYFWNGPAEIDYVAPDARGFAVEVRRQGSGLAIGAPRPLFGGRPFPRSSSDYSPMPRRYLVAVPSAGSQTAPITLVTNWAGALKR